MPDAGESQSKETLPTLMVTNQIAVAGSLSAEVVTRSVADAVISAPFILTNGIISQAEQYELNDSGKAIFTFAVTNAGDYLIKAAVNAPDESANSFYVNMDSQPEDPIMIWDVDVTNGFEERTISWRGNGEPESDEFVPKHFNLTAGIHKLIVLGREANTELKSVTLQQISAIPAK